MSKCSDKQWNKLWDLWSNEQVASPLCGADDLQAYAASIEAK